MKWDRWLPAVLVILAVAGAVVWQNREGIPERRNPQLDDLGLAGVQPPPDRWLWCHDTTGETEKRVQDCLDQLPAPELSKPATELIQALSETGAIFEVGARVQAGVEVLHVADHPEVLEAMLGTDEGAASKALRDLDVRALVVHRDFIGALDRDQRVLARLVYRDLVEWFQLRRVTDEVFVYTVRANPARIPVATGDLMLRGLRARLEGRNPQDIPRQRWKPSAIRIMASMRLQGSLLAIRHVVLGGGEDRPVSLLEPALDQMTDKLEREWERQLEPQGFGSLEERLDDIRLELHVVMERARVEPRSRYAIFSLWEMGVDGMMFKQRAPKGDEELDEKFTYLPGSELTTNSHRSADQFLRHAVDMFGWHDRRPWERDPRTRLDLIRTQHFMESEPGGGPAVRLVRGMPEVEMSHVTEKNVQDMLIAGGEWWMYNLRDDNSFEYKYWPTQNRRSTEYNEVRHILAARDLADTWRYRNDDRYLDGSRAAMDWLLQYELNGEDPKNGPLPHPPENTMLFRYPSYAEQAKIRKPTNQKLGTVAVALLGWVAWAQATGSDAEDEHIRRMARFVRYMQEADGRFKPYFVNKGHPYEKERNDIVPGEAMLALGMVAEYFDELEWVDGYGKFVDYYRPWFRERAKRQRPTGRWPHATYTNQDRLDLVQFGPWSVMAANQYSKITGDADTAAFGLEVADWMIDNYMWSGERSPWPDFVGGYYKLPNETPAMQSFCYSEGTAAAYSMAARHFPDRKKKYETATQESIRFLEVMQFDDLDSYFTPRPAKMRGGIKYTMNENKVRIDYVGHGLSTLSQYLDGRRDDPTVSYDIHDPTDLDRLAGSHGSVPGLDYGEPPWLTPGEDDSDEADPDMEEDAGD